MGNPLLINFAAFTKRRVETVSVNPSSVRFLILLPIATSFLALSAFHIDGSKMPVKKILNLFLLKTIKSEGFEPKGVIGEGAILFQKKSVGGGKINTKPKGSRKNKRTRRNKRTRKSRKINLHFK